MARVCRAIEGRVVRGRARRRAHRSRSRGLRERVAPRGRGRRRRAAVARRDRADDRSRDRCTLPAVHRARGNTFDGRRVPARVPRSRPRARPPAVRGAHARRHRDLGQRWADGSGRSVALPRRRHRQHRATVLPESRLGAQPPPAVGGRSRGRCRRDLQGAGDRRGVRARGSVPGRPRPTDARSRARRRRRPATWCSSASTAPRRCSPCTAHRSSRSATSPRHCCWVCSPGSARACSRGCSDVPSGGVDASGLGARAACGGVLAGLFVLARLLAGANLTTGPGYDTIAVGARPEARGMAGVRGAAVAARRHVGDGRGRGRRRAVRAARGRGRARRAASPGARSACSTPRCSP